MAKIKVYAKQPVALHKLLAHPIDGVMREAGSYWENDTWTYRRLQDGAITLDENERWSAKPAAPTSAPALAEIALANPVKKPKLDVSGV